MRLLFAVLFLSAISCALPAAAELALPADDIWALTSTEVKVTVTKTYTRKNVQVQEVYYSSRPYKGKPVRIFGYFAYPEKYFFNLPAILLVHGGGGHASLSSAVNWAKRGYAVLAIDLPGKGERRMVSRSGGPDMDVPYILRTSPDLSYNYLVNAVAAARNGITFLTQQPMVDRQRIGMVGLSWGGVITLMTNGIDKRLNTAVNVFGAGFIPEGCTWADWFAAKTPLEMAEWDNLVDPKNFLPSQHGSIFFITGTNDHCYYLPTFQKSYQTVAAPKKLLLVPNLKHQFLPDTENVVLKWLDSKLKYMAAFPEVTLNPLFVNRQGKVIVPVTVASAASISRVTLHYSTGAPSRWTSRRWTAAKPYTENGIYYFGLPPALIQPELLFFVSAADSQGGRVSSPVRSLFKAKLPNNRSIWALSAPIIQTYFHPAPLQFVGSTREAEKVAMKYDKKGKTFLIELDPAKGQFSAELLRE